MTDLSSVVDLSGVTDFVYDQGRWVGAYEAGTLAEVLYSIAAGQVRAGAPL